MYTNYLPASAAAARTQHLLEVAAEHRLAREARLGNKSHRERTNKSVRRRRFVLLPAR